jgi:hypothetical protein
MPKIRVESFSDCVIALAITCPPFARMEALYPRKSEKVNS